MQTSSGIKLGKLYIWQQLLPVVVNLAFIKNTRSRKGPYMQGNDLAVSTVAASFDDKP